ncbi:MAG: NIPSNAP family protein [Verrucomicrobiales bacterium]|nr:NIPSNAP family protein [Verrucomicrobiales bacterium]
MKRIITLLALLSVVASHAADTRLFEMRTYYANPGKLDELNTRFKDHTVDLFKRHGMVNIGYWVPADNPDNKLIYVLAYKDMEARDKAWKAFFADPDWKAAYTASIDGGKLVKKVDKVFMQATDYSTKIAKGMTGGPERTFQLRIYNTLPGRLKNLQARFRDHTVGLFEKHGISNIAYWTPIKGQETHGSQLIYIIAGKSEAGIKGSFKKFGQDPDWKKARTASVSDGQIIKPKGIDATFMSPTDYSPLW